MKTRTTLCILLLGIAGPSVAGDAPEESSSPITPTLDLRARYEFGDAEGLDASHAATLRARPGLRWIAPGEILTALAEGTFTVPLIGDYHGGAPGAHPFDPANTPIADPRSAGLNQAWLQISPFDGFSTKIGRQRIIHDDAAFLGNVAWRQNEQTYDAATLTWKSGDAWRVDYSWIHRVNRIYGYQADGIFGSLDADIHALDATHTTASGLVFGTSIYHMDFHDVAAAGFDNRTINLRASGKSNLLDWRTDLSWQNHADPLNDTDAWRLRLTGSRKFGGHRFTAGVEHLDNGFQSPLATLHIFNDYADAIAGRRAAGTHGGLTDTSLSHQIALPWGGMELTNTLHAFGDDAIGTGVGAAWDLVLTKPIGEHAKAMLKSMCFESRDARYLDTYRLVLQIEATY